MKKLLIITALFLAGCQVIPEPKHDYLTAKPTPVSKDLVGVWIGFTPGLYTQENYIINADGTGAHCFEHGAKSSVSDTKVIKSEGKQWIIFPGGGFEITSGSNPEQINLKYSHSNPMIDVKDLIIKKGQPSDISPHCRMLLKSL